MAIPVDLRAEKGLDFFHVVPSRISGAINHRMYLEAHGERISQLPLGGEQVVADLENFGKLAEEGVIQNFHASKHNDAFDPRKVISETKPLPEDIDPTLWKMVLNAAPLSTIEELAVASESPAFFMGHFLRAVIGNLCRQQVVSYQSLGHPMAAFLPGLAYAQSYWVKNPTSEYVWYSAKNLKNAATVMVTSRQDICGDLRFLQSAHLFSTFGLMTDRLMGSTRLQKAT